MSKEIKGNGKHLTLDDRSTFQAGLDQKKSFRAIAKELHKDPSTLAKEAKLNRTSYGRCSYTSSFEGLCKYTRIRRSAGDSPIPSERRRSRQWRR
ncbi:helix-turn-helix domain-containing protein [Bilifractor sp. LCP19S3_H10]|uniref:helix-turn-helix domain-containing protein n=1 Tax=Bilifractor sp. LCP19S3_H10 TaxID=3438736 RepID=UPI003F92AC53